jgi:ribose transport system ATP-binding protein
MLQRRISLEVADGEIHALLGANGAGKSTLIKCLSGAVQPNEGVIVVGADKFDSLTPREAHHAGIAVVYQDLSLAATLDVADNMFLGHELRFGPFVRKRAQRREAARWLDEMGTGIAPTAALSSLGNAGLQAVEIAKALCTRPKVLILDEPTAALSERESATLGEHLLELKKQNLPLLYVTHRLGEIFALADRVTVLRGGRVVLTGKVSELDRDALVDAIVGERIDRGRPPPFEERPETEPVLRVDKLLAAGIGPVSFDIRPGEVVGVFGLVGSGRTELLETLFGSRVRYGGAIEVAGTPLKSGGPGDAVAAGLALVPA